MNSHGQLKIVDYFCFAGHYPFGNPDRFDLEDLIREMDADGIAEGYVTDIGSVFRKEATDANVAFIQRCNSYAERLKPLAIIDLSVETFEKDIAVYSEMGAAGVRILPNYHGYDLDSSYCRRLLDILAQKKLMLFVAKQIEEPRFQSVSLGVKALSLSDISCLTANGHDVRVVLNNFTPVEIQNEFATPPTDVYFDVSAFDSGFYSMETIIEQWGTEAFVFGSQVPILYRGATLSNLRNSMLSGDDVASIIAKDLSIEKYKD
ncbi:MAG: hypothetical protein JW936_02130 [Sedimentisphaerales bacterium]|nr:hypothetical protein [Sedimentisphaerales bacterium]